MEEFEIVKTLSRAIYGSVALVRHRPTGAIYAMKMMSLAHIAAQQAVTGPVVLEDGNTELRVLRRISGNRVMAGGSAYGGGCGGGYDSEEPECEVDRGSWSVNPMWEAWGISHASAEVEHHNLLILHKDFVDERSKTRCLVFDFCPYGELYDQLQDAPHNTLGIETARTFFTQIVTAVRHIHAQNIAHRDLSLENVLLDSNRQCRLGDFGLSCEYGTMCSGRVGKTFYMAPEVYDWQLGELYNGLQADMWSLGIVLFILVTGAPPFETPSDEDARFRLVKSNGIGGLLAIWRLDMKLPHDLCDLLAQLLNIDGEDRIDIEQVWSHPWTQAAAIAHTPGEFSDKDIDRHAPEPQSASRIGVLDGNDAIAFSEPQEELDTEHSETVKARRRKRMKITIEPGCVESPAGECSRIAGFFGGPVFEGHFAPDIGPPPELRHENIGNDSSPHGPVRGPMHPITSPIEWPKIGKETAPRALFHPAISLPANREDEDEREATCEPPAQNRRRPRLDSGAASLPSSTLLC